MPSIVRDVNTIVIGFKYLSDLHSLLLERRSPRIARTFMTMMVRNLTEVCDAGKTDL